jgi:hypothetical protein
MFVLVRTDGPCTFQRDDVNGPIHLSQRICVLNLENRYVGLDTARIASVSGHACRELTWKRLEGRMLTDGNICHQDRR